MNEKNSKSFLMRVETHDSVEARSDISQSLESACGDFGRSEFSKADADFSRLHVEVRVTRAQVSTETDKDRSDKRTLFVLSILRLYESCPSFIQIVWN